MAIAHKLGVRYASFSSATLGATITRPAGIPQIASIVPGKWL
jgi:hypothetical protein